MVRILYDPLKNAILSKIDIDMAFFRSLVFIILLICPCILFSQPQNTASIPDSKFYKFNGVYTEDPESSPFRFNTLNNVQVIQDVKDDIEIESISENWDTYAKSNPSSLSLEVDKAYWMKASIIGHSKYQDHLFQVGTFHGNDIVTFTEIDAYFKDQEDEWAHIKLGTEVSIRDRAIPFWANLIKVTVPYADTVDLFVRVKMDPFSKRFLPSYLGLNHIDESSIWPQQIYIATSHFIFYAILVFQFVYMMLLYFMEREKQHLYLALLVIGTLLGIAFTMDNFREYVIFPEWRTYHDALSFLGIFFVILGQLKFSQSYFQYPKNDFISKWIIPATLLSSAVSMTFSYFLRDISFTNPITLLFLLISGIVSLYMAFNSDQTNKVFRRLYLIAFTPPVIVVFIMFLYSLNIEVFQTDNFNVFFTYLKFGFLVTLSALALSSGFKTRKIKEEKEDELKRNLQAEQEFNKAINKFVPNEFISALGKKQITEVSLGDHIEREVTVLFADIRGYTTLAEKLSPAENFKFVSDYSAQMGPIIKSHKGFINQYLGDGIMALFIDNPEGALRAAIDMHRANNESNAIKVQQGNPKIEFGIGLHTGPLILGVLGDEERYDAATISDTVNAAARLEGLTKYYGCRILLSEATMDKINSKDFGLRFLGPVKVKGKEKALKIFECIEGDESKNSALKEEAHVNFSKAVTAYFDKDFQVSVQLFKDIIGINPEDVTAKLFKQKAEDYIENGVEENWEGVESINFK